MKRALLILVALPFAAVGGLLAILGIGMLAAAAMVWPLPKRNGRGIPFTEFPDGGRLFVPECSRRVSWSDPLKPPN